MIDQPLVQCSIVAFVLLSGAYSIEVERPTQATWISDVKTTLAVNTEISKANTPWYASFVPTVRTLDVGKGRQIPLWIMTLINDTSQSIYSYEVKSEHPHLASVVGKISGRDIDQISGEWFGYFVVEPYVLGTTRIYVERTNTLTNKVERSSESLTVRIIRPKRAMDVIIMGALILLVVLPYVIFGADFDVTMVRNIQCPAAAVIMIFVHFIWMPLLSLILGTVIFPHSPIMRFGFFLTGISPSGGTSHICAAFLGANMDLSRAITTINNFAAFGMMPFWMYTYGESILESKQMEMTLVTIATFALGMMVPLAIGAGLKRCRSPSKTDQIVLRLKHTTTALLVFIVVFMISTNRTLFQLYPWKIAAASLTLTWLAFFIAWMTAKLLAESPVDALTIGIENSIQNAGIPICLLHFGLPQPLNDLATVVPLAVAVVTAWSLLCLIAFRQCTIRLLKNRIAALTTHRNNFRMLNINFYRELP